jgi:hypothetical protein
MLGIYANEDVRYGTFAQRLRSECGTQEIMTKNLGPNLPNTYARGVSIHSCYSSFYVTHTTILTTIGNNMITKGR